MSILGYNLIESDGDIALSYKNLESDIKSSLEDFESFINVYNKDIKISNEVLSDNAKATWIRTENSIKKSIENLKHYNKILMTGANRLSEELNMLANVIESVEANKPFKKEITISKPIRFVINGKFDSVNVRPIMSEFQNLLDFNDKVLFRYAETVKDLLTAVEFDETFLEKFNVDLKVFTAKSWLRGQTLVENDKRFSEKSTVYKGQTFNANRAIYYTGPKEDISSDFESNKRKWIVVSEVLSKLRFKCLKDINVTPFKNEPMTVQVSNKMNIKQRCNILSGIIKRLVGKANNINRHLDDLELLLKLCSEIKNKAEDLQDREKQETENKAYLSENRIFLESLILLRNAIRMTFDYYNVTGMFIKIMGSLGQVCDKEIKAYSEPMNDPSKRNETNE